MTVQQSQARNSTEKTLAILTREMLASYDLARKGIDEELKRIYATILSGVNPEDYYNTIIKYDRLTKLKAEVDKMYFAASRKAGRQTAEASRIAMTDGFYKNQYVFSWFTPSVDVNLAFTLLPPELVELSVSGNLANLGNIKKSIEARFGDVRNYIPKDGETLSAILAAGRNNEVLKINRAITSGLLQGNSYSKTSKEVAKIIGTVGQKVSTGAKANALRIIRTESNRTYNAGAYANTQAAESQGVELTRIWSATLDSRTRDRHQSLDGQTVGVDEPFMSRGNSAMFPGAFGIASEDIHCRCYVTDGIDGIPPDVRRGVNPITGEYELYNWQSYPDWQKANGLKALPSGRLA